MLGMGMAGGSFEKLIAGSRDAPLADAVPLARPFVPFFLEAKTVTLLRHCPGNKRRTPRPPAGGGEILVPDRILGCGSFSAWPLPAN
jgi:hypothetical protein